ncbi:hypothetical protein DM02DRAFT_685134 [Periconia macrospinosa]|uniref:Uncharacterized protein n=1 Tax=Periconia macrospinosa TaxID=97972 RepID=A0A2V1DIE8_9PLEO|nr:hypothetical protein DM02DRAFT_685134 [Periconia macrospinosa]
MPNNFPLQIQDLAFNVRGHALRLPNNVPAVPTYVHAKKGSTFPYTNMIDSPRSTIEFNEKELQDRAPFSCDKYLHIGYVPRDYNPRLHTKDAINSMRPGAVGIVRPNNGDILDWDENNPKSWPLVAVAKMSETAQDVVLTFVLLNPNSDICTPYQISHDKIFYLAPFRNNATSLKDRQLQWKQLVKRYTAVTQPIPNPQTNGSLLTKFTTIPDYADNGGHYDDDNFTDADAQQLSKDLLRFVPPVHCTPIQLIHIRMGLVESRTTISQNKLSPFLRQACYKLDHHEEAFREGDIQCIDLAYIVEKAAATVDRVLGV